MGSSSAALGADAPRRLPASGTQKCPRKSEGLVDQIIGCLGYIFLCKSSQPASQPPSMRLPSKSIHPLIDRSIELSMNPSYMSVCLHVCLSVCLFVCLSTYPSVYLSINLYFFKPSAYRSIYPSIKLSIYQVVHHLSLCPHACVKQNT